MPIDGASFRSRAGLGEFADPAHVALAARRHAVAHPVLFVDDATVELCRSDLLLVQLLVSPGLKSAKTLVEPMGHPAIEPDRRARKVREQAPVVADQRKGRADCGEMRLEPFDRQKVEVIGRLVKQKDFGFGRQNPNQRRPPRFTARELPRL